MAILGLTHDDRGVAVQRLPVSIKVAIGEGPDPNNPNSHPSKSDHFLFKRKVMKGKDVLWEPDKDVTKQYSENCREVGIVFMDDDIENVFRTRLSWWTTNECKCWGELCQIELNGRQQFVMQATRRTEAHPEGEPWPGNYKYTDNARKGQPCEQCGDGCPDLEESRCKPSADLYFQLDKFPMLGAVCRLHTSSYRSIRQISSALQQIVQTVGGLSGVRMMLKVRPEKGTYQDGDKKKSTTMHILSLELDADDWKKLLGNATEMKRLFHQQRLLSGAHRVEVIEDDEERAQEIASEFAPDNDRPALPPRAEIPTSTEEVQQRADIDRLCKELGFNEARKNMLLGQHKENLGELVKKLKDLTGPSGEPESKPAQTSVGTSENKTTTAQVETEKQKPAASAKSPAKAPHAGKFSF